MFKKAIVRNPGKSMINGLSDSNLGKPDFDLAQEQHYQYVQTLKKCGLNVFVLPAIEEYPDAVFVEDVALLTPGCAIISRPGADSRRMETQYIITELKKHFEIIEQIKEPGTLEAGDVMNVGTHYYIGLSDRTNMEGANQLIEILRKYGLSSSTVKLKDFLHLKSGLSYLENNFLAITGEFIINPLVETFNLIKIPKEESYAANCLWINNYVLMAKGYPGTRYLLHGTPYKIIELDMSEFRKLDGGLSCLSLRF